jgi:hypothetical protein
MNASAVAVVFLLLIVVGQMHPFGQKIWGVGGPKLPVQEKVAEYCSSSGVVDLGHKVYLYLQPRSVSPATIS